MKSCLWLTLLLSVLALPTARAQDELKLVVNESDVEIFAGTTQLGKYHLGTAKIKRPHFANLKTLSGIQVTRNHPPQPGDAKDHDTMHPGVWLAFGDISNEDFWRNKGEVRSGTLTMLEFENTEKVGFRHSKTYFSREHVLVCMEEFSCTIEKVEQGLLYRLQSRFAPQEAKFYFGDQEEMGLGVRVATPLTEKAGGRLLDSKGRRGAKEIWSQAAEWCDYSGAIDGHSVGATILCHPQNFRPSWFHARNYGLMVANPFGRKAMEKGPTSRVFVGADSPLVLRFAILLHDGITSAEIETCHKEYSQSTD